MGKHKLHLHSMMVHVIAALAPLAAIAYILFKLKAEVFSISPNTFGFLVYFSIITIFLTSIPSTLSGIFERNHVYAKWHSTHKVKLILSLILMLCLIGQISFLYRSGLGDPMVSFFGFLIIFGNNVIVFALGVYGFKISLGRQSIGKASYTPDLFKEEPVDILENAGILRKQEAKYLDLLTER